MSDEDLHHYADHDNDRGLTYCKKPHRPLPLGEEPPRGSRTICPECDAEWERRRGRAQVR